MEFTRIISVALVGALAGCASSTPSSGTAASPAPTATTTASTASASQARKSSSTDRDVITREQLAEKPSANLYDVVSQLRSQWLRGPSSARSSMSIAGVDTATNRNAGMAQQAIGTGTSGVAVAEVYVDGRRLGSVDALRTMASESADRICYLSTNRAQGKFGLSVNIPVIEVHTISSSTSGC